MTTERAVDDVCAAAHKLGQHPQDHGWRELYRLLARGLAGPGGHAPELADTVVAARARRPECSDTHLVTLLGIAVRSVAADSFEELVGAAPPDDRLAALDRLLARHRRQIDHILSYRQNSFTGARRFLLPQVLLAAYFARHHTPARFADLGTGLGILPRQLNSRALFDQFSRDLAWPEGYPEFRPIPLAARFGTDRGPLPDLAWVRACYGPSAYYTAQFHELTEALRQPEVQVAEVGYRELDLTDPAALRRFVTGHRINAANLCYALYEIAPAARAEALETLAGALHEPGLVIITEPNDDLTRPGCTVTVRDHARPTPRPVCAVSDGHFRGRVLPLAGYREFVSSYPIRFGPQTGPERPTRPAQRTGAADAASHDHQTG